MGKIDYSDAFELAYGKGRQKKWAKERVIMECLYETAKHLEHPYYLKAQDIALFKNYDSKDEKYFRYSFGYLYRLPKTQVDLCVNIKTGAMHLEQIGVGFGYDDIEKEVYKFIEEQIKLKNIYYKTSFNSEEFLVR